MKLYMRYYLAICIASCLWFSKDALAQDGSAVLDDLKRYDSIYEAGFTVSGSQKGQDLVIRFQFIEVKRNWRLAFESGRCGYVMEVIEYENPKFQRPQGGRGSLNADGWLLASIRKKQWGYWGEDVSGNHYEDTTIKISPENEVVEIGKMYNSSICAPRDEGPNLPKRAVLWSLGRFYSRIIDEISLVKESTNGRITVSALGRKGEGEPGRWELEIEPAAAWMVREARFYRDAKPEVINCEMKNSGTVWTGAYCIPEKALFSYMGPIEGGTGKVDKLAAYELTFDPVIEQFDEKLYDGAKEAVTKHRPPKLTIHDYRVFPPLTFQPDEILDRAAPDIDELLDTLKAVGNAEDKVASASRPDVSPSSFSTSPAVQSAPVAQVAQRPSHLLPSKWSVVLLIVAVVIAGCACVFLAKCKSRKS